MSLDHASLDPIVDSCVLSMTLIEKPESTARIVAVEGTGFLLNGGRGLGITARHVATNLEAGATKNDLHPYATGAFAMQSQPKFLRSFRIQRFEPHPTEDVALFRLADDDFYSPCKLSAERVYPGEDTMLWGYPDDIRHDYPSDGLVVDLVYSAGHIRRRIDRPLEGSRIPGSCFFEMSNPAGSCCSGSPVSVRPAEGRKSLNQWQIVGVYIGERRNEANTFAVGYATRVEALRDHWPQLFEADPGRLAELCA